MSGLPHLLLVIRKLNKIHEMNLESESWARGNLETNPITIKPETIHHVARSPLGFLTLLLSSCVPFPIKSHALSARVSPLSGPKQRLDFLTYYWELES